MPRMLREVLAAAFIVTVVMISPAVAQYSVLDLGTLPGASFDFSEALAINDRGQIVGRSSTPESDIGHAVLWQDGRPIDLGTLPGGTYSVAYGINNRGQIVGMSQTTAGNCVPTPFAACEHAFRWEAGVMTDLGALDGPISYAMAINERGQIAGLSTTSLGEYHAVLWDNGVLVDLGTLPGDHASHAHALNNRGQVIGWSEGVTTRAFSWARGTLEELGTFNGTFSQAVDINNRGLIVGVGDDAGTRPPVVWDRGTIRKLALAPGASAGTAAAVNDRGQIVGSMVFLPNEDVIPVIWERGGIVELPVLPTPPGRTIQGSPSDINTRGQIVGSSAGHAALWTRR